MLRLYCASCRTILWINKLLTTFLPLFCWDVMSWLHKTENIPRFDTKSPQDLWCKSLWQHLWSSCFCLPPIKKNKNEKREKKHLYLNLSWLSFNLDTHTPADFLLHLCRLLPRQWLSKSSDTCLLLWRQTASTEGGLRKMLATERN